jgi:hypothetical protein
MREILLSDHTKPIYGATPINGAGTIVIKLLKMGQESAPFYFTAISIQFIHFNGCPIFRGQFLPITFVYFLESASKISNAINIAIIPVVKAMLS